MTITLNGTGTGTFTDASGNVGIGTSSPGFRLVSIGGGIQLSGGTTSQEGVRIQRASGVCSFTGINNDNNAYNALSFATGASEVMRIDTSGFVGIGTSAPSAMLQVTGSATTEALKVPNIAEPATISATAATGTINYDVCTQSVLYYTSNASANWTVNFRGSSTTSLNTLMSTNDVITVAFLVTQGATPYYNNVVQVDGSSVTPKYQGGTAWTAGNASGIDVYTYTIIKTAAATFTVLASQTQFK